MKKILLLTDSVALPRKEPEHVIFEETWPFLLRKANEDGFLIHQVSMGGATTADLYKQAHYVDEFHPDIVIGQAGIVDCAPRALANHESEFINRFYITRKLGNIVLPKITRILRKKRNLTYIPQDKFQFYLEGIKQRFPSANHFWMTIINAAPEYDRLVPGITRNILEYNSIIRRVFREYVIELEESPPDFVMNDFHHLTKCGHKNIFEKVQGIINEHKAE